MKIHKFYEEVDGDITKLSKKCDEKEMESNIDTLLKLHKKLAYYKLTLKKYGAAKIYRLANVTNNVSVNDITDWVKCKENDYFAFIGYISQETGVEVLKITSWLNEITLSEGYDQTKENKALVKLKSYIEALSNSRKSFGL